MPHTNTTAERPRCDEVVAAIGSYVELMEQPGGTTAVSLK